MHGQRLVQIDEGLAHDVFVGPDFVQRVPAEGSTEVEIQITAFGERIARRRTTGAALRTVGTGPWPAVDPDWLGGLGALLATGLLAWGWRRGAFVLVVRRPGHAAVVAVASVSMVVAPKVWAGGGGGPELYWEMADPLGSGLLLVDVEGSRAHQVRYTPFGEVQGEWG